MQTRMCEHCNKDFTITDGELAMYEKINLEIPPTCFSCSVAQKFAFWPLGKFRKGKSDLSGESFITILPEPARYPIYAYHEWYSDAWDPMLFGQTYDPARSFFDQWKELQEKVPRPHQVGERSVGCDWCDDVWDSKNCYLCRSITHCEDVSYCNRCVRLNNSTHCTFCFDLENSYDCVNCLNSQNLQSSRNSQNMIDSAYCFDCRNCSNCFMCWNLRNASYMIRNVQYTKETYHAELQKMNPGSRASRTLLDAEFELHIKNDVRHRQNFNLRTQDSEGEYLLNCNRAQNSFHWQESEDIFNCLRGLKCKSCIDMLGTWLQEFCGNNSCCTGGNNLKYSSWSDGVDCEYLDLCSQCAHCFGCVGLRNKKYCILNTQYTKEEYEALKATIIANMKARGEYGKFAPYSMGLAPYNRTMGAVYMPSVTKEFVLSQGGYWDETNLSQVDGQAPETLPDNIVDATDEITKIPLICPMTHFKFNIAGHELRFYKRFGIALPKFHPDYRTIKQYQPMISITKHYYECDQCKKGIEAYYPPELGYKHILCIDCYQREVA